MLLHSFIVSQQYKQRQQQAVFGGDHEARVRQPQDVPALASRPDDACARYRAVTF